MFKSWRSDKKKIKAVFKLQFQATQVPKLKKPALTISLMAEDAGKPTFKLEKAAVQDGTCSWEKPIYVTAKLIQEQKTGKLHEKIYHFIVSSGSSKSGYLGEASIDFSDFAEETQSMTVSLPLKFANSGAVLHVAIQRMQEGVDQRYIEDADELTISRDGSLKNQLSNGHTDGNNESFTEDRNLNLFSSLDSEQGGFFAASIGADESYRQNSMPQRGAVDTMTTKNRMHQRSSTDWSVGSASDGSLVDSANSAEDGISKELRDGSDESIEKLKSELSSLKRQSELSELESQGLRKQVAKETKRAQELSRQVIELKEEKDAFRTECEQLKYLQKRNDRGEVLNQLRAENEKFKAQLEEVRRELCHEQELNSNFQLQLQKTQDSNSQLILAVRDLEDLLEQKSKEISCLSSKLELSEKANEDREKKCRCNMKEDKGQQQLSMQEDSYAGQTNADELCLLNQKITDLSDEIEIYKEDRKNMEKYIEQLVQDYEDLKLENSDISSELQQTRLQEMKTQHKVSECLHTIQELESQVQRLEEKLEKQTQQLSESLDSIIELESQVKALEKELEKQAQGFETDLDAMTHAKIEQEQRAIRAEENLRNTRWKNAVTAERLQEEFKRLSVEMAGKLDENENQTMKALAETDELRKQKRILEERLEKVNEELELIKNQNRIKVDELSSDLDLKTKQMEQILLELEDKSKQLRDIHKHGKKEQEALTLEAEHGTKLTDQIEKRSRSLQETEIQMQRWNREREELERKFASATMEAKKAQEELCILRSSRDEKETMVENLLSEVESLKAQYLELERSLSEEEIEKEKLRKQVGQFKGDLREKEEEWNSMEKKLRHNNGPTKSPEKKNLCPTDGIPPPERKVKTCSDQEQEGSIVSTRDEHKLGQFLTEMALLKERNKSMENELKEMQERYSELSLKFAEVEGERQQLVMTVRNLKNGKKN